MAVAKLAAVLEEVHRQREAGFNCAEGVFWGISQSLDWQTPVSCVTGFGGGVAGSGSVCGALCGAIAALGVYVGRTKTEEKEAKAQCTRLSKAVAQGFREEMGTQLCREILGYLPGKKPPGLPEGINPKCRQAVTIAIELALAEIAKDQKGSGEPRN